MNAEKSKLHPRNQHLGRYNFKKLISTKPELQAFVISNPNGEKSIDFSKPKAVKTLNAALLKQFYKIDYWDIPDDYLCPAVPGRADYIQNIADLLATSFDGKTPRGSAIKCMDIGVGANCIYPIIGGHEFGWSFIGTDIDPLALESAKTIVDRNSNSKMQVEFRLQSNPKGIFYGVFKKDEKVDVTICNPPFFGSQKEASDANLRKTSKLNKSQPEKMNLNFGGRYNEIWCNGGEKRFINDMIHQSKEFGDSCLWFTSLVSKKDNLYGIKKSLSKAKAVEVRTIPMWQGNKVSRIIAWTFHTSESQSQWSQSRWIKAKAKAQSQDKK